MEVLVILMIMFTCIVGVVGWGFLRQSRLKEANRRAQYNIDKRRGDLHTQVRAELFVETFHRDNRDD